MGESLREDINGALQQLLSFGFALLQAVIVLLGAAVAARALRRRTQRRLSATLAPESAKQIAENGVTLGVFLAALTFLLTLWGATWSTLLTAIGLSTLFVALGLQGVLQSFVAGVIVLFERPYNVGDHISFSGIDTGGTVEEITLRTTVIRTDDGVRVVAPNSLIFSQAVLNFSPDRAVLNIVTVAGAGKAGRTVVETKAMVEAALADVPGFVTPPEVTIRPRLRQMQVPRLVARFPRLDAPAEKLAQAAFDQGTQVRVTWSGINDPAVREEVLTRLRELFPDSRVRHKRW